MRVAVLTDRPQPRMLRSCKCTEETSMKSDTELQQDVMAVLNWEPAVNASRIGVSVKDGIATLSGHVSSYAEKSCAERIARGVAGVNSLIVDMDVMLHATGRQNDVDIKRAAESLLRSTSCVEQRSIGVGVDGGWVTLSGQMEWEFQRQQAARGVRQVPGVIGVSNRILVKAKLSGEEIHDLIEKEVQRRVAPDEISAIAVAHRSEPAEPDVRNLRGLCATENCANRTTVACATADKAGIAW
jgi:osmotically-inducible protein OsmY